MKKTILALAIVALSLSVVAQPNENPVYQQTQPRNQPYQIPAVPHQQPNPHNPGDRALNPQPLPPSYRNDRDHRDNDRHGHDRRDRDFRTDRDYRRWNDHDHRRNYETHRAHIHELRIGMRKREVLALPWWKHPLFVEDNGPFDTLVYADGRYRRCVLNFQFNRLAEIQCN